MIWRWSLNDSSELPLGSVFKLEYSRNMGRTWDWLVYRSSVNQITQSLHSECLSLFSHDKTDGVHEIWLPWIIKLMLWCSKNVKYLYCFHTWAIRANNSREVFQRSNRLEIFIRFKILNLNVLEAGSHFGLHFLLTVKRDYSLNKMHHRGSVEYAVLRAKLQKQTLATDAARKYILLVLSEQFRSNFRRMWSWQPECSKVLQPVQFKFLV